MSSRSRSPRGRAPSVNMLNQSVTVDMLPTMRIVDLRNIAKYMGLKLPSNMNKVDLINILTDEMYSSAPIYLGDIPNMSTMKTSTNGSNTSYDKQAFAQFAKDLVNRTNDNTMGYGNYRSRWQYLLSEVSQWGRNHGMSISAAQAAQMLDPFYQGKRENSNERSRSPKRGGSNIDKKDVQQFVNSFGLTGQTRGRESKQDNRGFRSQWQALVSAAARRYGINAAEAAVLLDPYYLAQRERFPDEPGNQSRRRSNSNGLVSSFSTMDINRRGSGDFSTNSIAAMNASTFGGNRQ